MKKTKLVVAIMMLIGLAMGTSLMAAGTEPLGSPREVSTLDHLLWISTNSSSWGDDFIQTANIDASATNTWNYNGLTYDGWSPIGNVTTRFEGNYDGNGFTIDGLFINRTTNYIGFFGYASGATIQDIGVTNVNITGAEQVGGLLGRNYDSSIISNSYSTGSVSGSSFVGGLVGYTYNSTVSNNYSTGSVSGSNSVGGLVGHNYLSTVSNSYSTGSVSSFFSVGGLVGYNNSPVENSFYDSETSGRSDNTGKGVPKTTLQMKTQSTFTDAGWDFTTIWNMDGITNDGYAFLRVFAPPTFTTWTGASSTSWCFAGNWVSGVVPDETMDAVIDPVATQPVIDCVATCKDLTLHTGAVLSHTGGNAVTVHGDVYNSAGKRLIVGGSIILYSNINIED
ncbi:hypothetical protein KAH81_08610 [bacterium]|nr:hypothetical protein [bacterium]